MHTIINGTKVLFCAPRNVNQADHGLDPQQVVDAVVTALCIEGPHWYTVEYDDGREISAHRSELRVKHPEAGP